MNEYELYREVKLGPFRYKSDLIGGDYMRRWCLFTPWGAVRVHHILRSDEDRHFHDHPFDFMSFILRGGYIEHRPDCVPWVYRAGDIVRRVAEDLHRLELTGDTWTFVIAGPLRRRWGFQTEDGWVDSDDYDIYLNEDMERRKEAR